MHSFDTSYQGARANSAPYTFNYTCGSGATLFVLSIVTGGTAARAGGAPTYNGVALTQLDQNRQAPSGPETIVEMWWMQNPPTGQSLQVSIPNTGTAKYLSPVASSYKATAGHTTKLKTANGSGNTSTNPTGPTLTMLSKGDVIVAVVGSGAQTWNPTGRTGTQLYDRDDGSYGNGAQYLICPNDNNVAMAWTFGTSEDWAIVEAAFWENPIFSDGFDDGTFDAWTGTNNTPTIVETPVHHGGFACALDAWNDWCYQTISVTEAYARLYYRFTTAPNLGSAKKVSELIWSTTTNGVIVQIYNDDGTLKWQILIAENDFTIHTNTADSPNPTTNTWYCVESYFKSGTANGAKLWVDGNLIITTEVTTRSQTLDTFRPRCDGFGISYVDCVVVADAYIGPEAEVGPTIKKGSGLAATMTMMLQSKMLFSQCNPYALRV